MPQNTISQFSGHSYTTSETAIKYRTTNSGNPLAHDDVDANIEILRKAVNGLVADVGLGASNADTNYNSLLNQINTTNSNLSSTSASLTSQINSLSTSTNSQISTINSELSSLETSLGNDIQAVENQVTSLNNSSSFVPTGAIIPFAGSSAPSGWLLCNGGAVSRSTYSSLFAAISTTYGTGNGSSTFNLPDLRGRVIAGQNSMGGASTNRLTGLTGGVDGDLLGNSGGAESHALSQAEMPAHRHLSVHGLIASNVPYYHSNPGPNTLIGNFGGGTPDDGAFESFTKVTGGSAGENGSNSTTSSYSTTAHNNVQPTIILNYIIKT